MMNNEQTDLYRLYDAEWVLLYVGISRNAFYRFRQHSRRPWWPLVDWVQIFTYRDRFTAEVLEAAAIRDESPLYNIDRGTWTARSAYGMVPDLAWSEVDYFDEHVSAVC
jgi:hypothetical protein